MSNRSDFLKWCCDKTMDCQNLLSNEISTKAPVHYHGKKLKGGCLSVPPEKGEGVFQRIEARNSLEIWRIRARFREPLILHFDMSVPHFEVCYCRSGRLTVDSETEGLSDCFSEGNMTINLMNYKGKMCYEPDIFQEFVCFYFHQDFLESLPNYIGSLDLSGISYEKKRVLYSPKKAPLDIKKLFEDILDSSCDDMANYLLLEAKSMEILSLVMRTYFFYDGAEKNNILDGIDSSALQEAARLIEQHLDRNITISSLSRMVGLNTHKLTQGFRMQFDSSINAYRKELRMKKSIQLLLIDRKNITETAMMIGYQNIGHFSSDFRKYYGVSPRDYIKSCKL